MGAGRDRQRERKKTKQRLREERGGGEEKRLFILCIPDQNSSNIKEGDQ